MPGTCPLLSVQLHALWPPALVPVTGAQATSVCMEMLALSDLGSGRTEEREESSRWHPVGPHPSPLLPGAASLGAHPSDGTELGCVLALMPPTVGVTP